KVVIGGASDNLLADQDGPQVDVFMNTLDFVFGGITDENPTLLVTLEDENGINVVGNSIGHDLEAVLDDDTQNTYLLNDFYEAKQDDYTQGEVRFPLSGLEEGLHTLQVKAWDVANNPAEGYTEFVVATTAEIALKHVLNYPNPFSDRTCFQFDHNVAGQEMDVLIQIYTVSGRLVKTLEQTVISDQGLRLDNCIEWDGRDDFGDQLARGVYLYKVGVRVNSESGLSGESDFQKLVLLK
ncbi:MAG: oxidoreductase, partial [Cyanothece sp. SIO1E1]|nr:oxidoreductase [Cyanothece sp. SIO1E1]